jgi:hypothetical protein
MEKKVMLRTVGIRVVKCILCMGLALISFSCVIPEKFTCNINIKKDGSYSVDAKGTLVYYTIFDEIETQGKISEETNAEVKSFFDGVAPEEPAIKKYQYQNNGRAYIEYLKEVNDHSSLDLSSSGLPIKIAVDADNSIYITISAIGDDEKGHLERFSKYGYKLDGTVTITSELPIIEDGGQKVDNKYVLFGPKVIKRTVTAKTLPESDITIRIK